MSKTVITKKGSVLPLTNLKGKDYLMVAYRLQWFNEEVDKFTINTEFLHLDAESTICRSTITIFDAEGQIVKQASATKRETKQDFPDHTEKAETSSCGRALLMLGFGTQFALSDLDEGGRLADSPVTAVPKVIKAEAIAKQEQPVTEVVKKGFGVASTKKVETVVASSTTIDGWE